MSRWEWHSSKAGNFYWPTTAASQVDTSGTVTAVAAGPLTGNSPAMALPATAAGLNTRGVAIDAAAGESFSFRTFWLQTVREVNTKGIINKLLA